MKKRIHLSVALFSICLLALCASSCISGDMDCKTIEEQSKVNILLTTRTSNSGMSGSEELRPGTEAENRIETLRAIAYKVYESEEGSVTYGKQVLNVTFLSSEAVKLTVDKGQKVRVFLIANGENLSLDSKSLTIEELKAFVVTYDSKIKTPLLMFGESRIFDGSKDERDDVSMKRNVARVDLTLTYRSDNENFKNGTLLFTEALVHRMTTKAGLVTPLASIIGEYRSSESVEFKYDNTANNGVFTTNTLTFYVPEHIVADIKKYTYITIKGTFTPTGGTSIPVEYDLPVGQTIKTEMLPNNSFTVDDLRINRNHLYDMHAEVKSLQQISEVHVKVTPWEEVKVSGDIKPDDARYYLNVLDIKPTLKPGETIKIQFWSNRPAEEIKILPTGTIKGSTGTFDTDKIFVSLAGNSGITMQEGADWGRLTLQFANGKVVAGTTYIITLVAGVLQRTIEVTAAEIKVTAAAE